MFRLKESVLFGGNLFRCISRSRECVHDESIHSSWGCGDKDCPASFILKELKDGRKVFLPNNCNFASWVHTCAPLNQRSTLEFGTELGASILGNGSSQNEFVYQLFPSWSQSDILPALVGEVTILSPVAMEPDTATVPPNLEGHRSLEELRKFEKVQLPVDVTIPELLEESIRSLLTLIPSKEWEYIRGSGERRSQISNFMNSTNSRVVNLRNLIVVHYIPCLKRYVQSMYPSLECFEINILFTEPGESLDQGIHVDVEDGIYALSVIAAIDSFRFFHCKSGKRKYVNVDEGECVMFSGGCAHGGAATNYPEKTYRIFVCFTQRLDDLPGKRTFYPCEDHPDVPSDYVRPGSRAKKRRTLK